jgi:FkbM family methyltransferase
MGFELKRYVSPPPENAHLQIVLSANKVNLVFDVGANIGQFALSLRKAGYRGRIVSFEPLADAWEKLQEASKGDDLWEIAPRGALGGEDGEIELHIAGNSQSSSMLNMLDTHLKYVPGSNYIGSERVPLRQLDTAGMSYLRPDSVLFIKADVQGFEDQVLKGAGKLLKKAVGMHLELTLIPLYEDQPSYDEIIIGLKSLGFNMWDFKPEYFDPLTGRMVWACGTFFRD